MRKKASLATVYVFYQAYLNLEIMFQQLLNL